MVYMAAIDCTTITRRLPWRVLLLLTEHWSPVAKAVGANLVNCWNALLKLQTLQRGPEGRARMLEKFEDWVISSQAPMTVTVPGEGPTTIPNGSRAQAGSKCEAPFVGEDIVWSAVRAVES